MLPENRTLLRIDIPKNEEKITADTVRNLMGSKPERRFKFIQENAAFTDEQWLDI